MPYVAGCSYLDDRPHQTMYWRRGEDYAIRDGDWKLTVNDQSGPENIRLFNMIDDPGEWHDVWKEHLDIAQRLKDKFDAWDSALPDNKAGRNPDNRNYDYHDGVRINVKEYNESILGMEHILNSGKLIRR